MARSNCWRISPGTTVPAQLWGIRGAGRERAHRHLCNCCQTWTSVGSSEGAEAGSDHSDLTTCDWTDEFCDCRDLGTIYSVITDEDLCARHYWKRLAQLPTAALEVGLKKPAAKVGLNLERREFGELL